MDQLLAKLTNFSYEFFGVILPGLVLAVFLALTWFALGPTIPEITQQCIPELTGESIGRVARISVDSVSPLTAILGLMIIYFLGHLLHWVGRSGSRDPRAEKLWYRLIRCLLFRIPKLSYSYDSALDELRQSAAQRLSANGVKLEWQSFYPVAKCYVSQHLTYSLIATYQNKYTLHRSLATASILWFWINALPLATFPWFHCVLLAHPRSFMLGANAAVALILVLGFSSSYLYHWKMFGNSVITESYALITAPERSDESEPT